MRRQAVLFRCFKFMHLPAKVEQRCPWQARSVGRFRLGIALACALTPALLSSAAQASLTVTVQQSGNAGETLWTFSGASLYSELNPGGKFAAGDPINIVEWKGDSGSDYVKTGAYNNYIANLISGAVSITVTPSVGAPTSGSIDALHIDHDNTGDDFGISLLGSTDIPLADNDLVSWLGSAIFPVEISKLNVGRFSFVNYGESTNNNQPFGSLPLSLSVAAAPGPLPLLGLGVAFRLSRNLRRTIRASRLQPAQPVAARPFTPC